jgi:hypothetical protein
MPPGREAALERQAQPIPATVAGKLMCVKCTHWFPYATDQEKKAFQGHAQTCKEGRCMGCGLVMRVERLFGVHREICMSQMKAAKKLKKRTHGGQRRSRGRGGRGKKEAKVQEKTDEGVKTEKGVREKAEQRVAEKMEQSHGRTPGVLLDYDLPEGEDRMDWDTDYLRRAFGEME